MSEPNYTHTEAIISHSDLEIPMEQSVTSPQGLFQYLQLKIPNNEELLKEVSKLLKLIYPELDLVATPRISGRDKEKTKSSMDMLITEIENLDSLPEEKFLNVLKTEKQNDDWFMEKECAGFLLLAFALKFKLPEMAVFLFKAFPNFGSRFAKFNQDSFRDCRTIYLAVFEFYREKSIMIFRKLIELTRKVNGLKTMKMIFFKNVMWIKRVTPKEFIKFLMMDYEDFHLFLKTNEKNLDNGAEIFSLLMEKLVNDFHSSSQHYKLKDENILTNFSLLCLENCWNAIFRLLIKFRPRLLDDNKVFKAALYHKNLPILRKFIEINENAKEFLLKEKNFSHLLDFFEREETFIDGIFLLNQIKKEALDIYYQRFLIMKFELLLSSTLKSPISLYRILLSHVNPFSVCCLLSDIFHEISLKNKELRLKFSYLAAEFQELAIKILEKLQNSINLHYLLNKTHFPCEIPILELLIQNKTFFEEILIKPNVYSIINEIWNSPYETECNFLSFSSSFCLLTGKLAIIPEFDLQNSSSFSFTVNNSTLLDSPIKTASSGLMSLRSMTPANDAFWNLFKSMRTARSLNLKSNFLFQKKVLVRHMGFRYFLEFLGFIISFLVILTVLFEDLNMIFTIHEAKPTIIESLNNLLLLTLESDFSQVLGSLALKFPEDQQSQFIQFVSQAPNNLESKFFCELSLYVFNFNMVLDSESLETDINECTLLYDTMGNFTENQSSNRFKEILLLFSTFTGALQVLFFCIKNKRFGINFHQLIDFLLLIFTIGMIYFTNLTDYGYIMKNFELIQEEMKVTFIGLILLLFVKFLLFMRMSKTLGVPLQILSKMMSHLSTIIIMFIIIFISFTIFMYFLYTKRVEQYYTLFKSIKTIFKYVFGEMAFYKGDSEIIDISYFAALTVGLGFLRVIFLNILIAILSNIYERIQKRSGLEIALLVHDSNSFQDPNDKTLNSLVVLPSPFNLVSVVFSPLLILKRSKNLNTFVLNTGYCLMLTFFSLVFIFLHSLILPVAWILILWKILTNSYGGSSKSSQISFSIRILHSIQWIIFGLFYLSYILLRYDLVNFVKKGFADVYKDSRSDELSLDEYLILKKVIMNYHFIYRQKKVKLDVFWKNFRGMFELLKEYEEIRNEEIKKSDELLILMKDNFENLSIKNEIDIGILISLTQNLKKMKERKADGRVVKYPHFLDLVNLKMVGETIKLFQYKKQLLK